MTSPRATAARVATTVIAVGGLAAGGIAACSSGDIVAAAANTAVAPSDSAISAIYKQFSSDVTVAVDGDFVVLTSNGIPNHKSPYFDASDPRYEAYNGSNTRFAKAPGSIAVTRVSLRIPLHPARAATSAATPLGPIGMALNGVPFFNQYNGQSRPLTVEIDSFDQYNGHPTPTNAYHYHVEPLYLTKTIGSDKLLGVLLDGFPVYGPVENGKRVTNADLDNLHGHTSATADFPLGIYHYHITDADPFINGAGFYGSAGTVNR
jgi:hypothetical protein